MIALLSCSTNLLASDYQLISPTGGLERDTVCTDSVLISYCDLRKVNVKLTELKYEKEINSHLVEIINNDSISISILNSNINKMDRNHKKEIKKVKKERNIAYGISITSLLILLLHLL